MATSDPLIGKQLGDYLIEGILGTGGMARVYRGYDSNLDRYAAIKVIEPQLIASVEEDEYRERFLKEARAIARLNHPQIVSVYQFNQVGNVYYIAMEYVEGRNLREILKGFVKQDQLMPTLDLMPLLHDVANALDYAHGQNIIHRDVKPSNIIVTEDGRAVLTDFGLALNAMEGTVGNTFGSVHYIAPEQAISSAQSVAQSDQYSLGIVAYEMLTGRVPFDDASAMSVALKHISDPPPPPTELNPNIPLNVEAVLLRVLDKEVHRRYGTCAEFVTILEEAFEQQGNTNIIPPPHLSSRLRPPAPMPSSPEDIESPTLTDSASRPVATAEKAAFVDDKDETPNRRMPLIVGLVVVGLVLMGVAGFAVLQAQNGQNTTGDETPVVVAQAEETQQQMDAAATETGSVIILTNEAATNQAIAAIAEAENEAATDVALNEAATTDALEEAASNQVATDQAAIDASMNEALTLVAATQEPSDTQVVTEITEEATDAPTFTPTPTATNTDEPSNTPTEPQAPTNTATDTDEPTNTPTEVPPSSPTIEAGEATATPGLFTSEDDTEALLFRYDDDMMIIGNRGRRTLNLFPLNFTLFEPDEAGNPQRRIRLRVIDAPDTFEQSATNFRATRCLNILNNNVYSAQPQNLPLSDGLCPSRPFWYTTLDVFWVSDVDGAYFELSYNGDIVGQCETVPSDATDEMRCAISLDD